MKILIIVGVLAIAVSIYFGIGGIIVEAWQLVLSSVALCTAGVAVIFASVAYQRVKKAVAKL